MFVCSEQKNTHMTHNMSKYKASTAYESVWSQGETVWLMKSVFLIKTLHRKHLWISDWLSGARASFLQCFSKPFTKCAKQLCRAPQSHAFRALTWGTVQLQGSFHQRTVPRTYTVEGENLHQNGVCWKKEVGRWGGMLPMTRASEIASPVFCMRVCTPVRVCTVCKVELQCCSGDGFCSSREPDKKQSQRTQSHVVL